MQKSSPEKKKVLLFLTAIVLVGAGLYWLYREYFLRDSRTETVIAYLRDPDSMADYTVSALSRCGDAPFLVPTDGMIGYLWGDSFRPGHRHQGIDVFGGTDVGTTPIYAAYDGYLTRLTDWKSTVIIRIPSDPLQPNRQIWTYYTHMADPEGNSLIDPAFPPGTEEAFVSAGSLLGYQGNFSGTPGNPTGVHLHFSIVLDNGEGQFLNELDISHTLDPSPYLGMPLNGWENPDGIPLCPES